MVVPAVFRSSASSFLFSSNSLIRRCCCSSCCLSSALDGASEEDPFAGSCWCRSMLCCRWGVVSSASILGAGVSWIGEVPCFLARAASRAVLSSEESRGLSLTSLCSMLLCRCLSDDAVSELLCRLWCSRMVPRISGAEVRKLFYFRPITLNLSRTPFFVLVVAACSSAVTRAGFGARIRVTG